VIKRCHKNQEIKSILEEGVKVTLITKQEATNLDKEYKDTKPKSGTRYKACNIQLKQKEQR